MSWRGPRVSEPELANPVATSQSLCIVAPHGWRRLYGYLGGIDPVPVNIEKIARRRLRLLVDGSGWGLDSWATCVHVHDVHALDDHLGGGQFHGPSVIHGFVPGKPRVERLQLRLRTIKV